MMLTYQLHTTSLVLDINLIPDSFPGVAPPNTGVFVALFSEIQRRLGTTKPFTSANNACSMLKQQKHKKQQLEVLP